MKKQLLTFSALALIGALKAQTIMPEVVSSSGGSGQSSQGSLCWTIGEPVITTVSSGTSTLTQGFQQPTLLIATALKDNPELLQLLVYPNPTADFVTLKANSNMGTYNYRIIDNTGKIVGEGRCASGNTQVSFQRFAAGLYTLSLTNNQNKNYQISIIKQN